jgi:hypothetical protein
MVYDRHGNYAKIEYGDNGYITTGYRFDSEGECNLSCFPIFRKAIEKLNGMLIACDGGHTSLYEDWHNKIQMGIINETHIN